MPGQRDRSGTKIGPITGAASIGNPDLAENRKFQSPLALPSSSCRRKWPSQPRTPAIKSSIGVPPSPLSWNTAALHVIHPGAHRGSWST
jgi:hypothetical protein